MAYNGLKEFIAGLEKENEIIRIKEYVSPHLHISEITDRISKSTGKALLFENNGSDFPLLINGYGSEKRICTALGVRDLNEIGQQIESLVKDIMTPRNTLIGKLSMLPTLAEVASFMPKTIKKKGKCQEVIIKNPDLSTLPVLTCWPFDGGPFITLPVVHTVHPVTGIRNVGMYRMQVFSAIETGMHWHLHKNSAAHYREYKKLNRRMPVSVVLGGDPVYAYTATAPMPENIDEYMLAGFLRKKKVELVTCITNDIQVPYDADFVIEGYVDPSEDLILEGPFGDHTGFYSLADMYPRFHVTCITHRSDAVYPTTIVGIPPQEDKWLGKATERIFLPLIKLSMLPELEDMVMPDEGVFHNIVLATVKKSFPGQAAKIMNSLWGAGQMMFNKILVILDAGTDLNNSQEVLHAMLKNVDPLHDIVFGNGPVDVLDHSSSRFALGSKMGIDATTKYPDELLMPTVNPRQIDTEVFEYQNCVFNFELIKASIPVLIVGLDKSLSGNAHTIHKTLFEKGLYKELSVVIYVDAEAASISISDVVWLVANNIDPVRDCRYYADGVSSKSLPLAIDGTRKLESVDGFKREWPNVLVMDDITINYIDENWNRILSEPFIKSPSLKYKKLVFNEGAVAK